MNEYENKNRDHGSAQVKRGAILVIRSIISIDGVIVVWSLCWTIGSMKGINVSRLVNFRCDCE
jgi:hypothetical protein